MARVLHHLDDALSAIRESLRGLSRSTPLLIKIVNETGDEELHVFKIDTDADESGPSPQQSTASSHSEAPPSRPRSGVERRSLGLTGEDEMRQELRTQQERISELELALTNTKEELHRALQSVSSPPSERRDETTASSHPASPAEELLDVSDDGASEAALGVSMLQLMDDAHTSPITIETAIITTDSETSSTNSDNDEIRKSGRQRKPVDRLSSSPPSTTTTSGTKRRSASAAPASSPVKKVKQADATDRNEEDDDEGDEERQIAVLATRLKEAYDRRAAVAIDSSSPSTLVQLIHEVFRNSATKEAREEQQPSQLEQWAKGITNLVTTSGAQKMLGYYLRSVLAHHLKHTTRQYSKLARTLLGIKSPNDIATYPAFFDFVQKHCPTIAAARLASDTVVTERKVEQWLREPIFMADISWSEWKSYLTKSHRHIIEAAFERFMASIELFKDWMQLGWVEVYDDEKMGGQGVRALRDIHLPTSKVKQLQRDVAASVSVVVLDLHSCDTNLVRKRDPVLDSDPVYLFPLDQRRVLDARHHWAGKMNHLPMPHCNLKLTNNGKIVQSKDVAAGDTLTLDYGVDYWVYQLTGKELSDWLVSSSVSSNKGILDLFNQMHDSVPDYSELLQCDWVKRRPAVWSELERESWMMHLSEYLESRGGMEPTP
jgi:hypothetical protein